MSIKNNDASTLLHQYSEWLDGEKLIRSEEEMEKAQVFGDDRSHEQLVQEFLNNRDSAATPEVEGL